MPMVLPGVKVVEEELLPVEAKALREWGILFMISLKRKKICSFRLSASTWRPRLRSCFRLGFFEHRIQHFRSYNRSQISPREQTRNGWGAISHFHGTLLAPLSDQRPLAHDC